MSRPLPDVRDVTDELFIAGLVLAAATGALALLLAPDPVNLWAAPLFLLLCLPKAYRRNRAARKPRLDADNPRTAMATITRLNFNGWDDCGDSIYSGTAVLERDGREITLRRQDYTADEAKLLESLKSVPVEYVPPAGAAKVRIDLVKLVIECTNPTPEA